MPWFVALRLRRTWVGRTASFIFGLENCPLCYGDERASVVGEAGSLGDDFCGICTDLE